MGMGRGAVSSSMMGGRDRSNGSKPSTPSLGSLKSSTSNQSDVYIRCRGRMAANRLELVGVDKGDDVVLVHGVHQERGSLPRQHAALLQDLQHGTNGIAVLLLANFDELFVGHASVLLLQEFDHPRLVGAGKGSSFGGHCNIVE